MHSIISLESGVSVEGQEILAFRSSAAAKSAAAKRTATKRAAARYCYLIAGTHGDEPEGVFVQSSLVEWLKKSDVATPFVIVPALNPDGLEKGSRCNANGVDLNRNLPASNWRQNDRNDRYYSGPRPLSEPENQFLLSLFAQFPPGIIMTFHSWKPMLNSNGECEDVLQLLHQHNGYPIVREEIDDHPTPGSLGSYVSDAFDVPVLTFECPTLEQRTDLESIWSENEKGLVSLMSSGLIDQYL